MNYSKMKFKKVIERINELYKLNQERELTEEEKLEQKEIREYYIRVIRGNVKNQLSEYKPIN